MRKIIIFLMLLCMHYSARGQTQYEYLYWFDSDISTAKKGSSASDAWSMEVDLSRQADGFHTIHLQVTDKKGVSSTPTTRGFFLSRVGESLQNGLYWFDDEKQARSLKSNFQGTVTIDVTELKEGFHTIHYQVLREDGQYSQTETRSFYKMKSVQAVEHITFVCAIDGVPFKNERVSAEDGNALWLLDVSELPIGFHKLQIRAITDDGASSSNRESFFLRTAMDTEINALSCIFSIDGKPYQTVENGVRNGIFHCDLDVAALPDGFHKISYVLTNGQGAQTDVKSQYFMKQPLGGNSIKSYQYWLNDNDDNTKTVVMDKVTDPLQLVSLLPVGSQPLRSSLFHFEVKNGQPMIYAKNDFHVRFFDTTGRFTDATDQFVDYNVGQKVNNIETLEPGIRATTNRPETNAIKWYQLTAERGDSLRFHADRACAVQLFAPSGDEVYKVQGASSVKWGGLHVKETGTFYLALHDVTATQGETLSVDYEHIDKYAILRQDVSVVGNGGASVITYEGNGFNDLYDVYYVNSNNDTIKNVKIYHIDQAMVSVVFDFTECEVDTYKAVFCFTEGKIVKENNLKVEEEKEIILTLTESHPKRYLRNRSVTYSLKVANQGNMTANRVPLFVFISSKRPEGLFSIDFEGLNLPSLASYADMESLSEKDRNYLLQLSENMDDDQYLTTMKAINSDGDSTLVHCGLFYIDIAPYSTKQIELKMKGNVDVEAWFKMPESWDPIMVDSVFMESRGMKAKPVKDCWKQFKRKWDQAFEDIENDPDTPNDHRCLLAIILAISSGLVNGTPDGTSLAGLIVHCLPFLIESLDEISAKIQVNMDNYSFYKELASDLPTDSKLISASTSANSRYLLRVSQNYDCGGGGGGGSSRSVKSLDPNEIYGYEVESGSKAIKDGLTDVSYTIQFENDTTFATAAAHDIWVRDTLNANKFDLSTYKPTKVKIGNKEMDLDGSPNFIATMGMQPEINAVAQIEGSFDVKTGIVCWHLSSLDPMTVEPTDDVMAGILPVNFDGQGIGEVSFDISLKPNLAHGTEIKNRAGIVFDTNDVIMTPYWTNTIDRVKPTSRISDVNLASDTTAVVSITASDDGSGPWRYNVYVQYGSGAWFLGAENVPADTTATVKIYEGIEHHFYCVSTDMAGNEEQKEARSEFTFTVSEREHGDVNGDGAVDVADIADIIDTMAKGVYRVHADANGDGAIDVADIAEVISIMAARARMQAVVEE